MMLSGPNWNIINDLFAKCFTQVMGQFCFDWPYFWTQIIDAFLYFVKKELYTKPMTIENVDISDMESICPDTPEEISMQITRNKYWWACRTWHFNSVIITQSSLGAAMSAKENEVIVLTTGGTFDKEYPKGTGGYAFEFGVVTGAGKEHHRNNT